MKATKNQTRWAISHLTQILECDGPHSWDEANAAVFTLCESPWSAAIERLMAKLTAIRKTNWRTDGSWPGVMSPENMLKSLAVQSLAMYRPGVYRKLIEQVATEADSPCLRGIAESVTA